MILFYLLVVVVLAVATSFLTEKVRQHLHARAVMDVPNERSMHKIPVPRGGGLAVMAVVACGLLTLSIAQALGAFSIFGVSFGEAEGATAFLLLLIGSGLLMSISWLDDMKGAGVAVRLGLHLLAALIGSAALGKNAMIFPHVLPFWLDRTLMVLAWAWFMNLYNFMDGIDGITGVETISIATGAGLMLAAVTSPFAPQGTAPDALMACLLIGASLGFLRHNWYPARIFLGDVGSVPLGFLLGFMLLKIAVAGYFAVALILPLYYLADSGITITRRALRGEKIWQPHRLHFYQRAAAGDGAHDLVVFKILLANMGLIATAFLAKAHPWAGFALGAVIVALLLYNMHISARKV